MREIKTTLAVLAIAAVAAAPAVAARPPGAGTLVPGRSLGGVKLGATPPQVVGAWGRGYGVCRDCATKTWYFNLFPFQPQGVGVEFTGGHTSGIFTLWSPGAWHDRRGITIGTDTARITQVYGPLATRNCGTYSALLMPSRRAMTVFYVLDGRLWGFGLFRPSASVCR